MTSTGRRGYVGIDRRWLADPDLSDSALRLMLWLDSHTHEYLRDLNVKRITAEIGWSRNRVKRTLDDLVNLGLVSVEQVPHADPRKTRTLVTLHHEVWSERGPRQTPAGVHDGPPGGVHGGAPTTSNPTDEESSSGTPKPPATTQPDVMPEWEVFFEHFWRAYPRKVGKPAARRSMKSRYSNETREDIVGGFHAWTTYWHDAGTEEQYIPHPATWLNQERYLDSPPALVPANKLSKAEEAIAKIRNRDQ